MTELPTRPNLRLYGLGVALNMDNTSSESSSETDGSWNARF